METIVREWIEAVSRNSDSIAGRKKRIGETVSQKNKINFKVQVCVTRALGSYPLFYLKLRNFQEIPFKKTENFGDFHKNIPSVRDKTKILATPIDISFILVKIKEKFFRMFPCTFCFRMLFGIVQHARHRLGRRENSIPSKKSDPKQEKTMADLLIVGSFAFDTINTQTARRENVLGGTGSHASYGASFFTKVYASGIVGGEDWRSEDSEMLKAHNIDIENLQIVPGQKTTAWEAVYEADMNNRSTLSFEPNCCVAFHPNLTSDARKCPYIFLANNSPESQMEVIEECEEPKLIVADTMDYYINGSRPALETLLRKVDGLILNDSEAQLLAGKQDLFECGDIIRKMGPRFVIIKKGAHGCIFLGEDDQVCVFPAYPSRKVIEPTGAGDCFGGSALHFVLQYGIDGFDEDKLRELLTFANAAASLVTTRKGALCVMPTVEEVQAYIKESGR